MTYGQPQGKMSFGDAPPQNDFSEMIPDGALAFAELRFKWFNFDQGILVTPSKPPKDSAFLDCVLSICPSPAGGHVTPWNNRKIFTRIGVAGSEGYINMGRSAIKAILETGRGAGPTNLAAYDIGDYADLDGLIVAIKVKIEPAKDGYREKNDIGLWLSPVDQTAPIPVQWARLLAGDVVPAAKAAPAGQPKAAAWANGAGAAQTTPAAAGTSTGAPPAQPSWLGQPATGAPPASAQPAAQARPSWAK